MVCMVYMVYVVYMVHMMNMIAGWLNGWLYCAERFGSECGCLWLALVSSCAGWLYSRMRRGSGSGCLCMVYMVSDCGCLWLALVSSCAGWLYSRMRRGSGCGCLWLGQVLVFSHGPRMYSVATWTSPRNPYLAMDSVFSHGHRI